MPSFSNVLFLLFFSATPGGSSQESSLEELFTDRPPLKFEFLSDINSSFPQDRLNCILKDRTGFLWVGTDRGLIRYDGKQIHWYRRQLDNPHSLSNEKIWALYEDVWGFIWVGTPHGLNRLNRFTGKVDFWRDEAGTTSDLPSMNIWAIAGDDLGRIWVGTDKGLAVAEPGSLVFQSVNGLAGMGVTALVQESHGQMLVGTEREGLRAGNDPEGDWPIVPNGEDVSVSRLLRIGADTIVGTWNCGFLMRRSGFWLPLKTNHLENHSFMAVSALAANEKGDFWVGFDDGLIQGSIHHEKRHQFVLENFPELESLAITTLLADWDDMLWVGTKRGGLYFHDLRQGQFKYRSGRGLETLSFFRDSQDRFWIGTNDGLFYHQKNRESLHFLKGRYVNQIQELADGRLIAISDQGLHTIDPEKGAEILAENLEMPWSFYSKDQDFFWIGGNQGLYLWHPDQGIVKHYGEASEKAAINPPLITTLDGEADHLWIGTYGGGVSRFVPDSEQLTRYRYQEDNPNSLSSDAVSDVHLDSEGHLWIATLGGGVNRLDPKTGRITRWTMAEGLPDNSVVGISMDANGILWFSTAEGLVRLNPKTFHLNTFSQNDGFYIGGASHGACWSDPEGNQLVFGGTTGAVLFDPTEFRLPPLPPLVFTNVHLDNQTYRHLMLPNETLNLAKPPKSLSLDVTLLEFRNQPQASVRFRREHIDETWSSFRASRQVSYTGYLPLGGQGALEVAGKTHYLDTVERQLNIKIKRPSWLAFLPLFVLVFLSLLIGLVHILLSRRMRKKQRRLVQKARLARSQQALAEARADVAEATSAMAKREQEIQQEITQVLQQHLEQVSTEISNDVHDGPLGSLYSLAFQLRALETAVPAGPAKLKIAQLSQETVPAMADRLRHVCGELLKPDFRAGLQAELLNYLEVIQDQAPHLDIEFKYQVHNSYADPLLATTYRIFRTLLKNIVKHAQAEKVWVEVADKSERLWLLVVDDGVGFTVPTQWHSYKEAGHYGLYMAHYFAQTAGGTFQVTSKPHGGTRIEMALPQNQGEPHGPS